MFDSIKDYAMNEPYTDLSDTNFFQGVGNFFTGNVDYRRDLEQLALEQNFSANEAAKARSFQEYLSSHSHQLEAQDLAALGLNPALTLSSGGANAYSAATASSPSVQNHKSGQGFGILGKGLALVLGTVLKNSATNARQAERLSEMQDMNDKKLNFLNQKLDADIQLRNNATAVTQAHYNDMKEYYNNNANILSDHYKDMKENYDTNAKIKAEHYKDMKEHYAKDDDVKFAHNKDLREHYHNQDKSYVSDDVYYGKKYKDMDLKELFDRVYDKIKHKH